MPKIKSFSIDGFDYLKNQWDVELSEGVTALIGPNGSGKTTLLDAWRSSLGLSRFGDRNLNKYIRQEGTITIKYDNLPDANGLRPFRETTEEDMVTIVQRFKRGPRNVERSFYILPGDFDMRRQTLPVKEVLGVEKFMDRMRKVGFTDAYLRILAQPQGQIWSLLTLKPHELFSSLLDITGDREVMDKLNNALDKVNKAKAEHQQIELEVVKGQVSHNELVREQEKLGNYRTWVKEKSLNQTMAKLAKLNELSRARSGCLGNINGADSSIKRIKSELENLNLLTTQFSQEVSELEKQKKEALTERNQADGARRKISQQITELLIEISGLEKELAETENLPQGSEAELRERASDFQEQLEKSNAELIRLRKQYGDLQAELKSLAVDQTYYPEEVRMARHELEKQGISYRQVSDVVEITDPVWSGAIEAFLGANRFGFIIDTVNRKELLRAKRVLRNMICVHQKGYPFWSAKPKPAPGLVIDGHSILAKVSIPKDILGYFTYLNKIKRVVTEDEAERWADEHSVESLAADGYHTMGDGRSRVLRIAGRQYCGLNSRRQRKVIAEQEFMSLQAKITILEKEADSLNRNLQKYVRAIELLPIRENNPGKIAILKEKLETEKQREIAAQTEYEQADLLYQKIFDLHFNLRGEEARHIEQIRQRKNESEQQELLKAKTEETLRRYEGEIDRIKRQLAPEDMNLLSQVHYEARIYEDNVKKIDQNISDFRNNEALIRLLDKIDTIQILVQNSAKRLALSVENLARRENEIKKAQVIYQQCLEDYRQHIKHIFAVLEQKLQAKAGEYDIRVNLRSRLKEDGEVDKDEIDLKVAFGDKALASYHSGDLSGGQKTVVSILLIMAAVQASAEINDENGGNIDFLIFDEPAASLDSHWFEEVGLFFKKSGLQIFFTAPEDEKIKNCWWVNQGIFTAIKKPGDKYAPPLDIVKFVPDVAEVG